MGVEEVDGRCFDVEGVVKASLEALLGHLE